MQILKAIVISIFLIFVGTFFNSSADAAEVLKKTTDQISSPNVVNNKVSFTVSGNVKLVRHAKSLNSSFSPTDSTGGTKSRTRITGFSYSCPGYYTTRIYSDVSGTKLLGYIQVYVSTTDIKNSKCDSIKPPPTPTPPTPPAPKPTHPDPLKVETLKPAPQPTPQKYETQVAINEPETKPPTSTQPEPLSWDKYCEQFNDPTLPGTKYKPMPVAKEGETYPPCCPTSWDSQIEIFNKSNLPPNTTIFSQSSYDYDVGDWICGKIMDESFDIEDTYCPSNQIYDSSTNQCKVTDNSRENYARITYTNDLAFEGHLYEPEPVEEETEEPTLPTEPQEPEEEMPEDPLNPELREGIFVGKFCKLDSGDYALLIGPSDMNIDDFHYFSRSAREDDYYLSNEQALADYEANGNLVFKKDASFELEVFRNNTGHKDNTTFLTTGLLTNDDFNGATNCLFDSDSDENDMIIPGESNEKTCADLICECIMALMPALNQIDNSVNNIGDQITVAVSSAGNQITTAVNDFHNEFETDKNYKINPMKDISDLLDENRLPEQDSFTDDTQYFTDQGDDNEGDYGKLPAAPEPSPWPGFEQDDALPPEQELQTDAELAAEDKLNMSPQMSVESMQQSPQMSVESMQQSPQMSVESMQQSPQMSVESMQQSPQMSVESMQQSPEMQQDNMSQTEVYGNTNNMTQNHWYDQTNTNLGGN